MNQPAFVYVEDDTLSREVMQVLIENLGYKNLTMLADTENFIARIEVLDPQPTIFFLDVHIGPEDGFQILGKIRAHPQFAHSTVIAVTASVMNEELTRLRRAGFNGAIAKPIDFESFPRLIAGLLAGAEIWHVV